LDDDPLVTTEYRLDRVADHAYIHAEVVEHDRGQAVTFAKQAQEQVLGSDVAVVRTLCFFLGERQNFLGALGEPLEWVDGNPRSKGTAALPPNVAGN
jgi:hypothetical protein